LRNEFGAADCSDFAVDGIICPFGKRHTSSDADEVADEADDLPEPTACHPFAEGVAARTAVPIVQRRATTSRSITLATRRKMRLANIGRSFMDAVMNQVFERNRRPLAARS
jgi:hypothetical protein